METIKIYFQLSVSAKLPNENDYSLELDLARHIVPDRS